MPSAHLAPVDPGRYRWAVHCCAQKHFAGSKPDRAVALFEHESAAQHFGRLMWPDTFEVVDLQSSGEDGE